MDTGAQDRLFGAAGVFDRVGKKRISKGDNCSRGKHQIRIGSSAQVCRLGRSGEEKMLSTSKRQQRCGVDGEATVARWAPCQRVKKMGDGGCDSKFERGDSTKRK